MLHLPSISEASINPARQVGVATQLAGGVFHAHTTARRRFNICQRERYPWVRGRRDKSSAGRITPGVSRTPAYDLVRFPTGHRPALLFSQTGSVRLLVRNKLFIAPMRKEVRDDTQTVETSARRRRGSVDLKADCPGLYVSPRGESEAPIEDCHPKGRCVRPAVLFFTAQQKGNPDVHKILLGVQSTPHDPLRQSRPRWRDVELSHETVSKGTASRGCNEDASGRGGASSAQIVGRSVVSRRSLTAQQGTN